MEYVPIVLVVLLRLHALQRLLHVVIEVLLVGQRLLIPLLVVGLLLLLLFLPQSLAIVARLPLGGGSCQAVPLSSTSTPLEVSTIAGRESSRTGSWRWLRLGQDVRDGGNLLVGRAIGKQPTLQIVGEYLLGYLILAGNLAGIQLGA